MLYCLTFPLRIAFRSNRFSLNFWLHFARQKRNFPKTMIPTVSLRVSLANVLVIMDDQVVSFLENGKSLDFDALSSGSKRF